MTQEGDSALNATRATAHPRARAAGHREGAPAGHRGGHGALTLARSGRAHFGRWGYSRYWARVGNVAGCGVLLGFALLLSVCNIFLDYSIHLPLQLKRLETVNYSIPARSLQCIVANAELNATLSLFFV